MNIWAIYLATQPWDPIPGRWVSLASLKTSGTYWRVVRNQDSMHEEHTHTVTPDTKVDEAD